MARALRPPAALDSIVHNWKFWVWWEERTQSCSKSSYMLLENTKEARHIMSIAPSMGSWPAFSTLR